MNFRKMHGLGNDFVVIDGRNKYIPDMESLSKKICNRNTGVGGDGLIAAVNSQRADIGMVIYNSDGSQAEMCGNGLRCFAKYVYEEEIVNKRAFSVDTLAGILYPELVFGKAGNVNAVIVNMGCPSFETVDIPVACSQRRFLNVPVEIAGEMFNISAIRMGVPHSVVFVDHIESIDVEGIGREIEKHPLFPEKTNVNLVQVVDRGTIKAITWERGAGRTLACGTGSCAAAVVSARLGKTSRNVKVELQLGHLQVTWNGDGQVFMRGPAANVFDGRLHGGN